MRRLITVFVLFSLLVLPAAADFDPDQDYMARMMEAVCQGDYAAGTAAEAARAEKMAALDLDNQAISFEELWLLSKIIYAEAGCAWLPIDWKMAVGEVVLNRIASPEFPDTMREVLEQPGQYYGKNSRYFDSLKPSPACVEAALQLLSGARILGEPGVVFQSNYRLGGGVYLELRDAALGSTYLCWSSHPELYTT